MIRGPTPDAISSFARDNHVDLIVMGTVAKTGVSGLLTGNTAEQTLDQIRCSILALKPSGFVCPIQLDDAGCHDD
jgi:nucleotide-binding universal stress UspA family protein